MIPLGTKMSAEWFEILTDMTLSDLKLDFSRPPKDNYEYAVRLAWKATLTRYARSHFTICTI